MPNGVIWGGAVDGSNQLGAMVTWKDTATSPVGVWAATPCPVPRISRAATRDPQTRLGALAHIARAIAMATMAPILPERTGKVKPETLWNGGSEVLAHPVD